jgi:hypothetical protein
MHGAARATEDPSAAFENLGATDERVHPRCGRTFNKEPIGEGMRPGGTERRTGLDREQHERAGLGLRVPFLDLVDGPEVAHQDGVHEVTEETLGQLGIAAAGGEEIAEGAEHVAAEAITGTEQRGSTGSETDAVALQLFECLAPRGHLRQRLFGLTCDCAFRGFALAGTGEQVAGLLGFRQRFVRVARVRRRDVRRFPGALFRFGPARPSTPGPAPRRFPPAHAAR